MKKIKKLKLNSIHEVELEKHEMSRLDGTEGCGCYCSGDSGTMAWYAYDFARVTSPSCSCVCYCNDGLDHYGGSSNAQVGAVIY